MGLFTVGLRDDDFEPAYKFPALPHRVRGRCLVAFAGVHLAVHVVRDLVHIDADTTNHGVYAADDFAGVSGRALLMCYPGFLGNRRNRMSEIRIADLFAGIGGIRMGMVQALGDAAHVVYSSEWNKYSVQTYEANWHDENPVAGDITKVDEHDVPDIDLLLAGFPCQPFSIAGVSKKQSMGRPTGFEDKTQGTLFFDVARIIKAKQPKAFLLENVKNLLSHDRGRTFKTIYSVLTEDLGYHVTYKLIDAAGFVPQHRERTYIVGFREENGFTFDDVKPIAHGNVGSILLPASQVPDKYVLSDKLWTTSRTTRRSTRPQATVSDMAWSMPPPTTRAR